MAKSLQEQLLQSGVARPKQAKKARREKTAEQKAARRQGQPSEADQALQQRVAAEQAAKQARDRQLNADRKQQREHREREHGIAQIIERHRVAAFAKGEDTVAYSYNIDRRIRRIEVGERQRRDLAAGRLGIVCHDDRAFLVERTIAQRLAERIPERLWLVTPDPEEAPDPEDPYAAFPVPDDLMW